MFEQQDRRHGQDRRQGPDRRHEKRWRFAWRENAYRDAWLVIITGIVVLALWASKDTVDQQRRDRQASAIVVCTAVSAVIDAGRQTILAGAAAPGPTRFQRALERLGYPSQKVRQKQAQKAAEAYAGLISSRVVTATGIHGVVRKDGSLDCRRLQHITHVKK